MNMITQIGYGRESDTTSASEAHTSAEKEQSPSADPQDSVEFSSEIMLESGRGPADRGSNPGQGRESGAGIGSTDVFRNFHLPWSHDMRDALDSLMNMESQGIPVNPAMIFDSEVKKSYIEHKEMDEMLKRVRES